MCFCFGNRHPWGHFPWCPGPACKLCSLLFGHRETIDLCWRPDCLLFDLQERCPGVSSCTSPAMLPSELDTGGPACGFALHLDSWGSIHFLLKTSQRSKHIKIHYLCSVCNITQYSEATPQIQCAALQDGH